MTKESRKEQIKQIVLRDGITSFDHIKVFMPYLSDWKIDRAFRELEREEILFSDGTNGARRQWKINPAKRMIKRLPVASNEPHAALYNSIRQRIIETQQASRLFLKQEFRLGSIAADRILHHFRREGIVMKGERATAKWRVLLSRERAQEIGMFDETNKAQEAVTKDAFSGNPVMMAHVLEEVRFAVRRAGVASYYSVRKELPWISSAQVQDAFARLESEQFLVRQATLGSSVMWRIHPAREIQIIPSPKYVKRPELYGQIRSYVIREQKVYTQNLRTMFKARFDTTIVRILHHLANEGILKKNSGRNGRWRVAVSIERAQELGILAKDEHEAATTEAQYQESTIAAVPASRSLQTSDADIIAALVKLRDLFGTDGDAGTTIQRAIEKMHRLAAYEVLFKELVPQISIAKKESEK